MGDFGLEIDSSIRGVRRGGKMLLLQWFVQILNPFQTCTDVRVFDSAARLFKRTASAAEPLHIKSTFKKKVKLAGSPDK